MGTQWQRLILSLTILPIIGSFIGFLFSLCIGCYYMKECMLFFASVILIIGVFSSGEKDK